MRERLALVDRPTAVVAALLLTAAAVHPDAAQSPVQPVDPLQRVVTLDPRWTLAFTTTLAAPAGFDQQAAYVPLKDDELVAIDLDRGTARWHVALATSFAPATGDGLVFAGGGGSVSALDQGTGQELWRTELGGDLSGPLFWDSGWLLASTASGDLVALRAEDGRILWRNALGSALAVPPTTVQDRLFVALRDQRVAAIDLEAGTTLWTNPLNEPATGMLALNEQLLIGTRANRLHSVSLDRGRSRWTQKAGADVIGAPAADADLIYYVAFDNVLRALHRRSGNLKWVRNLPSRPSGGAVRADNVVFVPLAAQGIGAYLPQTGAEAYIIRAAGEISGTPFIRESARPTAPRLVALSREGALQAFAARYEGAPALLAALPGAKVGG